MVINWDTDTFPSAMAYLPAGTNLQNERVNLDPWSPQTQHETCAVKWRSLHSLHLNNAEEMCLIITLCVELSLFKVFFLKASREYNEFLPLMPFIATNYLIFTELYYNLKATKTMKSV